MFYIPISDVPKYTWKSLMNFSLLKKLQYKELMAVFLPKVMVQ
jgi:hypothetical protein